MNFCRQSAAASTPGGLQTSSKSTTGRAPLRLSGRDKSSTRSLFYKREFFSGLGWAIIRVQDNLRGVFAPSEIGRFLPLKVFRNEIMRGPSVTRRTSSKPLFLPVRTCPDKPDKNLDFLLTESWAADATYGHGGLPLVAVMTGMSTEKTLRPPRSQQGRARTYVPRAIRRAAQSANDYAHTERAADEPRSARACSPTQMRLAPTPMMEIEKPMLPWIVPGIHERGKEPATHAPHMHASGSRFSPSLPSPISDPIGLAASKFHLLLQGAQRSRRVRGAHWLVALMRTTQEYAWWQLIVAGGMRFVSICVSFNGGSIDSLVFALGALLVVIQLLSVRNELYLNVFEITVTTLFSFLSAALAWTGVFCYSAVASSSVALILPVNSSFSGFSSFCTYTYTDRGSSSSAAHVPQHRLGLRAEAYEKMTGKTIVGSTDYACSVSHDAGGPWWQRTPSLYWAFLTVPTYSLFLSMRNHAPWQHRDIWGQTDNTAAVGAFAVGTVANVYARFFTGNAFAIMITGILFQLPSGLGNGGLLTYASEKTVGNSSSYLSGFQTALQLISVAIGLTVGLGISLVIAHPIQSRRRAGGVFSL
ncbi:hypothetical protein DFH06DRAFT_1126880 [Mycena polygramma]|nr:hypothetical protein DFH06DRAFT_1126880 [Mycena polygramma]